MKHKELKSLIESLGYTNYVPEITKHVKFKGDASIPEDAELNGYYSYALMLGKTHTQETKDKISKANKGKPGSHNGRKGVEHSEEAKDKMKKARVGKTPAKGIIHSKEAKAKISEGGKGLKRSAEGRENIRQSKLGIKRPTVVCPHCNIEGGTGVMNRWHFHHCKQK